MRTNRNHWLAVAVCLALSAGSGMAQKQRYSQSHAADPLAWPLTMHVISARTITQPSPVSVVNGQSSASGASISILHLEAVVDGQKIELEAGASALLHTGDYQARVVSQDEKKSGWFTRTYELLFADGTHVIFTQVGESN